MKDSLLRRTLQHLGESFPGSSPKQHRSGSSAVTPSGLPELPVEIWLLIAQYLEPREKKKLLGVNRLFYELAMDELYHHMSLVSDDPWLFIDTMETLRNPQVGYRVRSVTIWPVAVWKAMSNPQPEWSRWLRESSPHEPSWWRRHFPKATDYPTASTSQPPPPPPVAPSQAARIALFNNAILNLTHVEDLTIYVNGTVENKIDLTYPLTECLHKIWAPLKATLRHVAIDVPCCLAAGVLPQANQLPTSLQHVELMLRSSRNIVTDPDTEPPHTAVARFVQDVSRIESLRAFKLSPDRDQGQSDDLWHHLLEVQPMENITSLSIENIGQLSAGDPRDADLHQWILRHPQLEALSLSFSMKSSVRPRPKAANLRSVAGYEDPGNETLLRLASLSLKLDRPADYGYATYLEWVSSIAPNVSTMLLKNLRRISHLRDVLDHFSAPVTTTGIRMLPNLQRLELCTDTLCPDLLDMLATRCPNLRILTLDVQVIATQEGMSVTDLNRSVLTDDPVSPFYVNVRVREETDVIKKIHANEQDSPLASYYRNWKLEDVSVLQWVYGQGRKYNWEVMSALARVTPSIRSFVGRGHMGQGGLKELEPTFELVGFGKRSEAWSH